MNNCSCCFTDFIAKCETEIRVHIILPVYSVYRWVITDGFGQKYQGVLEPHAEGGYSIPVEDLPDGLLNQYSGTLKFEVFQDGEGSCAPEQFVVGGKYSCIEFTISGGTFEKNNLGCEI
jgi:hypothetical protein